MRTGKCHGPSQLARCHQEKGWNLPVTQVWQEVASDSQKNTGWEYSNPPEMAQGTRTVVSQCVQRKTAIKYFLFRTTMRLDLAPSALTSDFLGREHVRRNRLRGGVWPDSTLGASVEGFAGSQDLCEKLTRSKARNNADVIQTMTNETRLCITSNSCSLCSPAGIQLWYRWLFLFLQLFQVQVGKTLTVTG